MEKRIKIAVVPDCLRESELTDQVVSLLSKQARFQVINNPDFADIIVSIDPAPSEVRKAPHGILFIVVAEPEWCFDNALDYFRAGADDVVVNKGSLYDFEQELLNTLERVRIPLG